MSNRGKKKAGAWIAALVTAGFMAVYALFTLIVWVMAPEAWFLGFALWGLVPLAVIAGVFVALAQRLKEIDSGEEDDAAQY